MTETDATFDDVTLSPKTVGAVTSYSRRTLINAVPAIEEIVRHDLTAVIAEAIDYQALFGDGTGNTPIGVDQRDGRHQPTPDADVGGSAGVPRRHPERQRRHRLARLGDGAGCRREIARHVKGRLDATP